MRGSLHTSLSLAPSDVDLFSMSTQAQGAVTTLLELVRGGGGGGPAAGDGRMAQVAAAEAATSEVIFDCKPFKALVAFACDRAVESDEVCLQWFERGQPVQISTQGACACACACECAQRGAGWRWEWAVESVRGRAGLPLAHMRSGMGCVFPR